MRWLSGGSTALVVACAFALPLAGCDALGIGGKKEEEKSSKDTATSTSTATSTATTVASTATPVVTAPATASQTTTATATTSQTASATATATATTTTTATATTTSTVAALPGHTPVPTVDEWNQVTNEVTVVNSSKLGCETKALREWVRISCKNKNDTGGTPTTVVVDKGGGKGDTFTLAQSGITSLVFPFAEGTDLEATFGWSDKKSKFKSFWPVGTPKPPAYGAFDLAPGPIAKADPKLPIPSAIPRPVLQDAREKLKPILNGKLPPPPKK